MEATTTTAVNPGGVVQQHEELFQLIEQEKWDAVSAYIKQSPPSAQALCRPAVSSVRCHLPLHQVCTRNPPLSVVQLLLDTYAAAIATKGEYGYLPLHVACRHGASYDVVSRLIEVYPAATRCREDREDALPLHLAARYGAPEDVLMAILTTHPEGSFIRDSKNKTPLEHAQSLPEGKTRDYALTALETAPILVATAKAASRRVQRTAELKLKGIQDAHSEYIRQLEKRQEDERTEFLQMEVQFHNELASEKERNCQIAECLLGLQQKQSDTAKQNASLQKGHDQVVKELQTKIRRQHLELQKFISQPELGLVEDKNAQASDKKSSNGPISAPRKQPDPVMNVCWEVMMEQLNELSSNYQDTQSQLVQRDQNLKQSKDMVYHLNQLLTTQDKELSELKAKLAQTESKLQDTAIEMGELQQQLRHVTQQLDASKQECSQMSKQVTTQQKKLQESNKQIRAQDQRFGNIKNLVASLNYNLDHWEEDEDSKRSAHIVVKAHKEEVPEGDEPTAPETPERPGRRDQNVGLEVSVPSQPKSYSVAKSMSNDTVMSTKVPDSTMDEEDADGDMSTLSHNSGPQGAYEVRALHAIV